MCAYVGSTQNLKDLRAENIKDILVKDTKGLLFAGELARNRFLANQSKSHSPHDLIVIGRIGRIGKKSKRKLFPEHQLTVQNYTNEITRSS